MGFVFVLARLRTESSLSGHWCGAGHELSNDKVSKWNGQRGLIRVRVNNESISISVCMYIV